MSRSISRSEALFARARDLMPGGVSSPVRAFRKVGGTPRFLSSGQGSKVTDEDGNVYTDFCMAWGPLILGHAHPAVIEAVIRAARDGLAFGATHRHEQALAERVLAAYPRYDRVRFVVSGTEAVLTALRLARAATGRTTVLKFAGCYHGHVDSLLVRAGSGVVTQGLADSAGVSAATAADTLVVGLGDWAALEEVFRTRGDQLAAVIIEPVPANNGLLMQDPAWLRRLRDLATAHGALLIFDEVITGFRFGYHGYGALIGVDPDLVTLGKIVGGGLPVGAIAGNQRLLDQLAPLGPVYQAGTMAGNPVALAAGIATLDALRDGAVYARIEALGQYLDRRLAAHPLANVARLPRNGPLFWPYFDVEGVLPGEADQISSAAVAGYNARYAGWLDRGFYLPPSAYEVSFLSGAHSEADIDGLLDAMAAP